jgi:ADP-heptose:LPS heptosyltransferase
MKSIGYFLGFRIGDCVAQIPIIQEIRKKYKVVCFLYNDSDESVRTSDEVLDMIADLLGIFSDEVVILRDKFDINFYCNSQYYEKINEIIENNNIIGFFNFRVFSNKNSITFCKFVQEKFRNKFSIFDDFIEYSYDRFNANKIKTMEECGYFQCCLSKAFHNGLIEKEESDEIDIIKKFGGIENLKSKECVETVLKPDKFVIAVCPCGSTSDKIIPINVVVKVISGLLQLFHDDIFVAFFIYGETQYEYCESIISSIKSEFEYKIFGFDAKLTLIETMMCLQLCNFSLCVDSSCAHMCGILGVPNITIYRNDVSFKNCRVSGNYNKESIQLFISQWESPNDMNRYILICIKHITQLIKKFLNLKN